MYDEVYSRSINDPVGFWADAAEEIHWYKKWDKVLDESRDPFYRWFAGGEVNTCYNAIDRHIANGQKILRGTMQKIADSQEYKVPAMIDDPAALAEIQEVLSRSGSDNAGSHP